MTDVLQDVPGVFITAGGGSSVTSLFAVQKLAIHWSYGWKKE